VAKPEVRLTIVGLGLAVGLAALMARAAQVQLVDGGKYAAQAESQRTDSVELPARRGTLYDRAGVPLATTQEVFHVGLDPRELRDRTADARRVARQLGLSESEVRRALRKKYAHFEGPFSAAQVLPLRGMAGVYLTTDLVRSYPDPDFAQPILGRPGVVGRSATGLERQLDSLLSGRPGAAVVLRDSRGRSLESPSRLAAFPMPGHDVFLTLDAGVQEIVETALADAIERLHAAGGDVVVLDPHTGEVLALTSRRADGSSSSGALTAVFEPGSTAKIFAAAALIAHGLVGRNDSVFGEGGKWKLPHRTITDDHHDGFTWMRLEDAIRISSNIGTVKFASRLDPTQQYTMLRAFGVGAPTGIDFPAESRGRLHPPAEWSGVSAQSLAIGYEMAVTPLQLAAAYAAIANDGVLLQPALVKRVRDPEGRIVYDRQPEPVRRVVRPEVAAQLRDMLRGVVSEGGTGAAAALTSYELAGKTGTARVAGPGGRYVEGAATAVFAALFPAEDPQLAMVVKLDSPRGSYAALTAAPLTRRVLEQVLAARTGALDRGRLTAVVPPPAPVHPAVEEATWQPYVFAWPDSGLRRPVAARRVPNVTGLSLKEAVGRLHRAGLRARTSGFGRIVRTSPAAGDSVAAGTLVTVYAESGGKP
jgi:cell division protein FtsI (penicillin-binding protein 3)